MAKKTKAPSGEFPHEVLEILTFGKEFPELNDNMKSPFRAVAKQLSVVAGDSVYAAMQSQGNPQQLLAGQLRVAIDNMEVIPSLIKTSILGNMQSAINDIIAKGPEGGNPE